MTYGAIARKLGLPGGARAVGYAMAACPNGKGIPWHRVVGAGGRLLIPEPYGSLQRRLLESEEVEIGVRGVDLKQFGWPPLPAPRKLQLSHRARARRFAPKS